MTVERIAVKGSLRDLARLQKMYGFPGSSDASTWTSLFAPEAPHRTPVRDFCAHVHSLLPLSRRNMHAGFGRHRYDFHACSRNRTRLPRGRDPNTGRLVLAAVHSGAA